jgi:predicted small lipoprotein YifL
MLGLFRNRRLATWVLALAFGAVLAGCGKKGSPQPPEDTENTYPRSYPAPR